MARGVVAGVVLGLLAAGCCSSPPGPPDWQKLGPVIDVHCHVFNGRDLPIAEWLNHVHGVPPVLAGFVEHLVDSISEEPPPRHRRALNPELLVAANILRTALEDRAKLTPEARLLIDQVFRSLVESDVARDALESLVSTSDMKGISITTGVGDFADWALLLASRRASVPARLVDTYEHTSLFTPSIIDMSYWFGDDPQGIVPWSIPEQRLLMDQLIEKHKGRVLPFLAFDPERERLLRVPGVRKAVDLENELKAAANDGYLGVKLYPPFGYRPIGNAQIDAGHRCGAPRTPAQRGAYDAILMDLFRACVKLDLAVQAHCENPGAGAKKCGEHADPAHWERLLADPALKDLRLDLMHMGGDAELAKPNYQQSWAGTVVRLMERRDRRVYADVGAHEVPNNADLRKKFLRTIGGLPLARERVMFGTDWHLIVRHADSEEFANRYLGAWEDAFPAAELQRFAHGAAYEYLGLDATSGNGRRVRALIARKGWPTPDWLR